MQEQEEGVHQVSGEQGGCPGKPEQSFDRGVEISEGAVHWTEELDSDSHTDRTVIVLWVLWGGGLGSDLVKIQSIKLLVK